MPPYWQIILVSQILIGFEKTVEILTDGSMVPAPKTFYANETNMHTGLDEAAKRSSQMLFSSALNYKDLKNFKNVKKSDQPLVDGNWGNWGEYGAPSKTCDEALRTRQRLCNSPPPSGGGEQCEGDAKDVKLFELGRCVMKELDTEFKKFNMGMWTHTDGKTPGFFWKVQFGPSKSKLTGPQLNDGMVDPTGDGYYLIADSSSGREREDQAVIISKSLTPAPKANRACLKFRYHMHGSGMGLLAVKISRDSKKPKDIWQNYGDHGDQWVKAKVTLKSSVKFQVLFVAAIGTPQLSDIALDNIYIDNGPCKCQDEYLSCTEWAQKGRCTDDQSYYWMAENCKTTCKTCGCHNVAKNEVCRHWAESEKKYCSTHQTWMSAHCQLSCKLCTCRDYLGYEECQARVGAYECETQPQWMANYCKLSCGFCDCDNLANDGECSRRSNLGECDTDAVKMSSECKFSCGYCNCKDRHPGCAFWMAKGECEKNPVWMHAFCTFSCGKCRCHDKNAYCEIWKDDGECHKNPLYMNAFCQKSCKICSNP